MKKCSKCGHRIKKQEVTYKVGQKFMINQNHYILCQVDTFLVCLISLNNGNRYVNPLSIKNTDHISKSEMKRIAGNDSFKLIEE